MAKIGWTLITFMAAIATLGMVAFQTAPIEQVAAMTVLTMSYAALAYDAHTNRL